ncbi:aminotransferase class I/II-fold pyridoxal phosphate-dependent enzyme [Burkholderia humptydooensis]|uniref:aminotransferase class I/II-fold pyridoxal phosphate-dependent enzyme n=1 Tax=Burkholderia humptydooensis TaxID=430531 RepID=UPI00039C6E1D|nr:aminotransferase class I/II-fold pyridoxal phosphate-dependent enzyme [Burkholderia humptydooensis]
MPATTDLHAAPARAAGRREIFLNLNESPFGPFDEAEAAAARARRGGPLPVPARRTAARSDRRRARRAHRLGVAVPGSNRALHYATLANRPVRRAPLRADGAHDVAAMCEAAPRGLIYVANPNNPTGTVTPHDALRRLLSDRWPGTTVLVDEAYIEYSDEPSMLDAVRTDLGLIVARTFSKIYGMAGLRLGYAVAQPDAIGCIHTMPPHDVSVPVAAAALASLALRDRLGERKAYTAAGRDDLIRWFAARGVHVGRS